MDIKSTQSPMGQKDFGDPGHFESTSGFGCELSRRYPCGFIFIRSLTSSVLFLDSPFHETDLRLDGSCGFDGVDSIYASPEDFKSLRQRDKNNGLQLLHYFVTQCHEIGVACEAWIKTGDAKDVICHEVKRFQPDLLVVGNRGLGPFQKVFVGTVSEFVTKHADCPVISIKRSADQTPQDPAED